LYGKHLDEDGDQSGLTKTQRLVAQKERLRIVKQEMFDDTGMMKPQNDAKFKLRVFDKIDENQVGQDQTFEKIPLVSEFKGRRKQIVNQR
jgi:hypothetical protein